jgi:hypothetical protein
MPASSRYSFAVGRIDAPPPLPPKEGKQHDWIAFPELLKQFYGATLRLDNSNSRLFVDVLLPADIVEYRCDVDAYDCLLSVRRACETSSA